METLCTGLAITGLGVLAGCGGGGGGAGQGSGQVGGTVVQNPNTGLSYIVEPNQGGNGGAMKITGVFWGRLVDVYDLDSTTNTKTQVFEDFLIGESIVSNGVDYLLDRNAITEKEVLTILHKQDSPAFAAALAKLQTSLQPFVDKSLDPTQLPPYTTVPRNAAVTVRFDDLLDDGGDRTSPTYPGKVTPENVQLRVGTPPVAPFGYRLIPDPNHGDVINGKFHSTRVILDMTVSSLEAQATGLGVNSLGLPAAKSVLQPNIVVRIPTIVKSAAAQFGILRNLSGKGVSFSGNGSTDSTAPTLDVVRAARSGGTTKLTGDKNNGFLLDEIAPEVLGAQSVAVTQISPPMGPQGLDFLVDVQFNSSSCASRPLAGDVIQLPNHVLQATADAGVPIGGLVLNVPVRVIFGNPAGLFPVVGQFRTTWDPASGALPECFFRFSPPAQTPPNAKVATDAGVVVTFSEPMDPASVTPLESFRLEYGNNPGGPGPAPDGTNPLFKAVVGNILPTADLATYTFEPSWPLRNPGNPMAAPEPYVFVLGDVTDLAGNSLGTPLPPVGFTLDPAEPKVDTISASLNFATPNEDLDAFNHPEVRGGQVTFDLSKGELKPRPVDRITAVVDASQTTVGAMVPISNKALQTPLSNLGSKLMTVWRYHDMGFGLLDEATHNLDVEAIYWEPFGGTVQIDTFDEFQMSIGHCTQLPDEHIDKNLLPVYPKSGLFNNYNNNIPDEEALTIVSKKTNGYQIHPLDLITGQNGTTLMPWPMNQDIPQSQFTYWTWRNTALEIAGGAKAGDGVDTNRLVALSQNLGFPRFWQKTKVPSIGLPLLMEFRTYPSATATGLNGFQIAIALNSSANPYFRTFSTGGVPNSGVPVTVDPDQQNTGSGGINPGNGKATPSQDNAFYYGQADFVIRVSRTHTVWFDMGTSGTTVFAPPLVEPEQTEQPTGTSIVLAYRGAAAMTSNTAGTWTNAGNLDPYGNSYDPQQHCWLSDGKANCSTGADLEFTPTFYPDAEWHDDITELNGARYVQVRVSMICNPETGLIPVLSGLGISAFQ